MAPPGMIVPHQAWARPGLIVPEAWGDEQIEALVLHGNVARARQQLVAELAMQIVQIDRASNLTYAQR